MHVLENNHTIYFDKSNYLEMLNIQDNVYISPVLDELELYIYIDIMKLRKKK